MSNKDKTGKPPRIHTGSDATAPYPVSRMAPAFSLVDLAREISQADVTLASHANNKLKLIAKQIKQLQDEARQILDTTRRDQDLHRAECNFKRQPGQYYHLYKKPDGRLYFSMLSPGDWNDCPPHHFEGTYRLELDMSWTASDEAARDNHSEDFLQQFIENDLDRD